MVFTFAVTSQSKRIFVLFYNNNSRSGSFEDQGPFYVSLKEVPGTSVHKICPC